MKWGIKKRAKRYLRYLDFLAKSIGRKTIIYVLTPPPYLSNIGDHGQVVAIKKWFSDFYPDNVVLEFDKEEAISETRFIRFIARKDSPIFLHSGGNMGDRGIWSETGRRKIIEAFCDHEIVSLPQTIFFSDTAKGRKELETSREIYARHPNLLITARDHRSGELAAEYFPRAKRMTIPDFVLYLHGCRRISTYDRKNVLLCLRKDDESIVQEKDIENIEGALKEKGCVFDYFDTTFSTPIRRKDRDALLDKTLKMFSGYRLVITDRFHGVIFSVITNTPCVVLKTVDHKLSSAIDWFEDTNYVFWSESSGQIGQSIQKALCVDAPRTIDWTERYFEPYARKIQGRVSDDKRNVSELDLEYLCVGCGACRAVCSVGAIEMALTAGQYMPVRDPEKCVDCRKCVRVCPGIRCYEEATAPNLNQHADLGGYVANYIGFGNDQEIRKNCASGGLCSEILGYMLEENIIDGAIITRTAFDKGYGTKTFVARTPEEVLSAKSSIYGPTSPLAAIGDIDLEKRYAFVGLPCHIQGLRKLMKADRKVARAIKFSLGLFCGRGVTSFATDFLLNKFAEGTAGVKAIRYRGNGWPGGLSVEYRNGRKFFIPHNSYWPFYLAPYFFCPYRCLSCSDFAAEYADISLGDAWLPEVTETDSIGTSITVVRNEDIHRHFRNMEKSGRITLRPTTIEKVVQSQQGIILRKKHSAAQRSALLKRLNKPVPANRNGVGPAKPRKELGALLAYLNAAAAKKSMGLSLLGAIPMRLLNRYRNCVFKHTSME